MLELTSPAKLNLFLHITGQRQDGYHELQTLFQLLDTGDRMTFSSCPAAQITLECPGLELPMTENLAWRAASLLRSHSGCNNGAVITINKQLPVGGGLGGGSSNAATTLLALNKLWQLQLPLSELAALGLKLGADVPVVVYGRTAWAEGVGERLQPVDLPPAHYLVIAPNCHVNTGQVFSRQELTRNTAPIKMAAFFRGGTGNDCQNVVRQLYPEVDKALIWLDKYSQARLTGTGACVFGEFETRAQAEAVYQELPGQWRGFVATGLNQSPVHAALT